MLPTRAQQYILDATLFLRQELMGCDVRNSTNATDEGMLLVRWNTDTGSPRGGNILARFATRWAFV